MFFLGIYTDAHPAESQQIPSFRNAMRQLAISAGSLGSLGAAFCHVSFLSWWIDDHLPWFFGDQHGSASFAEKN
jgi:hypothetical protein